MIHQCFQRAGLASVAVPNHSWWPAACTIPHAMAAPCHNAHAHHHTRRSRPMRLQELRDLLLPPGPPGFAPPKLEIRTVAAPPLPSTTSTPGSASTPGGSAAASAAAAASGALADGGSYTHIPYLTSVEVSSPEEVLAVLARGNAIRATAATNMHEHSSRSHCVLRVEVEGTPVALAPVEPSTAAAGGGSKAIASTRSFFGSPSAAGAASSSSSSAVAALADAGGVGPLDPSFGPVTATLGRLYLVDLAGE